MGANVISALALAGLITMSVPKHVKPHGTDRLAVAVLQSPTATKTPSSTPSRPAQKTVRQMGEWLEAHKNFPPDQQLKLLESEPAFKKLTPDRQNALRERLKKFNSMPPEKRQQALKRMEFLAKLTPQQREQLRDASKQLQGLPQERQVAVHKALRHLRKMPPPEREQILQSDLFRSTFSDQEQKLISQLAAMPGETGSAQNPQAK
jgi:hypothetical protein